MYVQDQNIGERDLRQDSVELPAGTEKYLKLMMVREPLTRLVSGYHNKLIVAPKRVEHVKQISNKTSGRCKRC